MPRPDIEAIRARLEAATEGEWAPSEHHPAYVSCGEVEIAKTFNDHPNGDTGHDAAFIAGAKQDVPALLAYVEELEGEIRRRDAAQTSTIQNLTANMNEILERKDGTTPHSKGARAAAENILNALKGDDE